MYNKNTNVLSAIIQSPISPRSTNVLWDDMVSNTLKVYRKGIWTVIGGAGGGGGEGSSLYWGYDAVTDVLFPLEGKKVQINNTLTVNGDIRARKLSVEELTINGEDFTQYWELNPSTNTLYTNYQVKIGNNLIVEGDTSSGGTGQDTPSAGLDEKQLQDYLDLHKYVTEGYVDDAITALNVGQYAKASDLENLQGEVDNIETVLGLSETAEGYINTWAEVVAFLDGYKNADDLATILSGINADIAKNAENIATLDNDKADKATTLAGYGITDAYTKSDLESYKTWWDAVMGLVVKDGNNIRIKTNLIVEGDTSSGGSGQDTPASGTVTGVTVGSTNYTDVNAGLLNLTTLMGLYTPLSSYNGLASRVATLEGKATAVSFTQTQTSGTKIGSITIDGVAKNIYTPTIPTKVSAFTNDSGYITGITKSMVASALGASTGGRYLIDTGGDVSWANVPTKLSQFTDDVVSGKYLPLSGGKMTGTIMVGDFTAFGQTGGNFYLGTPAYPLLLRSNGTTTINGNTLIHSGNIGSYALKTDGSNSMGTSAYIPWATSEYAEDYSAYGDGFRILKSNVSSGNYRGGIHVGVRYGWQLTREAFNEILQVRFNRTDTFTWEDWKTIAFTDSDITGNAGSATKLQTARTIWGQSFDGSGNVDGILTLNYSNTSRATGVEVVSTNGGEASIGFKLNDTNRAVVGVWGTALNLWTQTKGTAISIPIATGNVLIGTTTDLGYKLDVAGTGRFTGAVTMSSSLSVGGNTTINGNLVVSGDIAVA